MTVLDAAAAERGKLRRVLGRLDTVFFLISAMVVVDTIGAIAVGGGEKFTWLVASLATGWSALAAICLLWPGLGTANPDASLPAGFASQRWAVRTAHPHAHRGRPRRGHGVSPRRPMPRPPRPGGPDHPVAPPPGSPVRGRAAGAKMEVISLISGFATMYGGMQAALASERAGTGSSAEEQAAAPVQALARAAASGQYPHLAAALAAAGPARGEDDVFESCIMRLIDVARPNDHAKRPIR